MGIPVEYMRCGECGWIYDKEQINNYNIATILNPMSIDERKKWYQEQIDRNPNYNFIDANIPSKQPHLCPICHKYTFEDIACYDICPYCGFEDDGNDGTIDPDSPTGPNELSFNDMVKEYNKKIAANPHYMWEKEAENDEEQKPISANKKKHN